VIELLAALLILLVGGAAAVLVLRLVVAETRRSLRGVNLWWAVIPGVAVACGIVATVVWGPIVVLVIGVACLIAMLLSLPLIARSDMRRHRAP
jgi:hypothetical protein